MYASENLKKRLRHIHEYHVEEYAQRLEEIGGPGVGGTEPRHYPHSVTKAEAEDELKMMALQQSVSTLWSEATWCYVYGQFRACITLMAALLEATLKLEFQKRGIEYDDRRASLGRCIENASGFIPEWIARLAYEVSSRRNDVVHANIETQRPGSILHHSGPEHEVEPIRDMSRNIKDGAITGDGELLVWSSETGWQRVYLYKRAAKETIETTERILGFLYPE